MIRRHSLIKGSFALLLIAGPCYGMRPDPVRAQDHIALVQSFSAMGEMLLHQSGAPGLVVGGVQGERSLVLGFGETRLGSGRKAVPSGGSVVRIGSISKVLTCQVLASMVVDGIVRLTDPLAKYAPASVKVPELAGRAITLLDLATYTAGLPRDLPDSIDPRLARDLSDGTKIEDYWRWLSDSTLAFPPSSSALYSNFGYVLLGEALAKAAGKPYRILLKERVLDPLGMVDTSTELHQAQIERMMIGIDPSGNEVPMRTMPATMDPAGNVYSTAHDMIRWMRWQLAIDDPPKGADIRVIEQAAYRWRGGLKFALGVGGNWMDALGLGWTISLPSRDHPLMLIKTGSMPGFMSYVALAPTHGVGIFVAFNRYQLGALDGVVESVSQIIRNLSSN
jgi:serine-type D-Ala-D-Ala carboxypeptidase/endopeptidase